MKVADRYGYELRLFDEAGFAYLGPMLSVVVKRDQFWTQVSLHLCKSRQFIISIFRDIICMFLTWMSWAAFSRQQSGYFLGDEEFKMLCN